MGKTYKQRSDLIVEVLNTAGVKPAKGTLDELAASVLDALDSSRETIR